MVYRVDSGGNWNALGVVRAIRHINRDPLVY